LKNSAAFLVPTGELKNRTILPRLGDNL